MITVSIRSTRTGKPESAPGFLGAIGITEPEGSDTIEAVIEVDEGHQVEDLAVVLGSASGAASAAFLNTFGSTTLDADKGTTAESHTCSPDCAVGVVAVDPGDSMADVMEKIRAQVKDQFSGGVI